MTLNDLPTPPIDVSGWPWTIEFEKLPNKRLDGSSWPRITIVTPSFSQGRYIEETVRSVLLQGYPNLEYFVIDGGSKDETIQILERYSKNLTYWHSRADKGQADAINYVLERATGIWFHNVNSDDILMPGVLAAIGNAPHDVDLLYGDVIEFTKATSYLVKNSGLSVKALIANSSRTATQSWHQPGLIFKTGHLRSIGGYSTELQYLFDHHGTCRYLERFRNWKALGRPVIRFRIHDGQKSTTGKNVFRLESIASRLMLASELQSPRLRAAAKREAMRLELRHHVASMAGAAGQREHLQSILLIIRSQPRLLFERMLLGHVRRHPSCVLSALFGRK